MNKNCLLAKKTWQTFTGQAGGPRKIRGLRKISRSQRPPRPLGETMEQTCSFTFFCYGHAADRSEQHVRLSNIGWPYKCLTKRLKTARKCLILFSLGPFRWPHEPQGNCVHTCVPFKMQPLLFTTLYGPVKPWNQKHSYGSTPCTAHVTKALMIPAFITLFFIKVCTDVDQHQSMQSNTERYAFPMMQPLCLLRLVSSQVIPVYMSIINNLKKLQIYLSSAG